MKTFVTTNGHTFVVSDKDAAFVRGQRWSLITGGYVVCTTKQFHGQYLHRLIMQNKGIDIQGKRVDHHDRDKCNNQRRNLRLATPTQNNANSVRANEHGFKGVKKLKGRNLDKPYSATVQYQGKRYYLGYFKTAKEAHKAYICKAKELFGKFAWGS